MSVDPVHFSNQDMLSGLSVTLGATFTSNPVNLENIISYSVQFIWAGGTSPVGSVILNASNDGINYTPITDSLLPVSGNSGSNMINVEKRAYSWVSVTYTRTSGTGPKPTCILNSTAR